MLIRDAKAVARNWVMQEAGNVAGFRGAYLAGSTSWLSDDATLPATSDLDINVVWSCPSAASKRGKFVHQGVLLDITPLSHDQVRSPELVLGHYHLAGGFRRPGIILDPSGELTKLQAAVARDYAKRHWVRRRCGHARARVSEGLAALDGRDPFHDQVLGWLFPTGVTAHVLLIAGLKNPTVRSRYVAARELLAAYGQEAFYETLLELLGCARLSRGHAEHHLAVLAQVFDVAKTVIKTPFPFASDISSAARPLAIDGSRDLIERDLHREAMFWIGVTYSRCLKVLAIDAATDMPDVKGLFDRGYRELLGDLGITSSTDIQRRSDQVEAHLDRVWEVAEAIMAGNAGIEE